MLGKYVRLLLLVNEVFVFSYENQLHNKEQLLLTNNHDQHVIKPLSRIIFSTTTKFQLSGIVELKIA